MAARGQQSKNIIGNKIMEVFPDAFLEGKTIRIPLMEDGAEVQVKVTLTAAKDNIPHGVAAQTQVAGTGEAIEDITSELAEPTEDELSAVRDLMQQFNL